MAVKTHTWISLWFLLTTPVILWDVGYCFMRPRSMIGGDLHWIWEPYGIYQNVDLLYGIPALEEANGFTNAQSLMNILETILNLTYLYLAHISPWPPATLIGFGSAALTLSKTMLYWAQEYFCGFCATGQNDVRTLVVYWVIPNGLWLLFPALIVYTLGKDLVGQLGLADRAEIAAKERKSE
ncbi:hypothetical protein FB446DRAFT_739686 [Lentinula raphanica]|nr:hypothetical protein FB446DRAFT_739686 [Lentinula raphanica]